VKIPSLSPIKLIIGGMEYVAYPSSSFPNAPILQQLNNNDNNK
jgi:hypothetical protein